MSTSGLAKILIKEGLLTPGDCQLIASDYAHSGASFAKIVVALGILSDEGLAQFLARHTHLEQLPHPDPCPFQAEVRYKIDQPLLERLEVVPLSFVNNTLKVAMVDPLDRETMAQLRFFTPYRIKPVIASFSSIYATLHDLVQDFHPAASSLQSILAKKMVAMPRVQAQIIEPNSKMAESPAQHLLEDNEPKISMSLEMPTEELAPSPVFQAPMDDTENLAPDEPELSTAEETHPSQPEDKDAAAVEEPILEEVEEEAAANEPVIEETEMATAETTEETAVTETAEEALLELPELEEEEKESTPPFKEPVPAMAGASFAEAEPDFTIASGTSHLSGQTLDDIWSEGASNTGGEENQETETLLEEPVEDLADESFIEDTATDELAQEEAGEEQIAEEVLEQNIDDIHPDLMNAVVDDALRKKTGETGEIFADLKEDLNLESDATLLEPQDEILPLDNMLDHEDVLENDAQQETESSQFDISVIASKLNYALAKFSLNKDPAALIDFATLELIPRGLSSCLLIKMTPHWHKVLGWDGAFVDSINLANIQEQIARKVASTPENVLSYMSELGESAEEDSLQPFAARLKGREPYLIVGYIHLELANSPVICDLLIKLLRRFT